MRKLIVCNVMSLDGYYTGPGNDIMALALLSVAPSTPTMPNGCARPISRCEQEIACSPQGRTHREESHL